MEQEQIAFITLKARRLKGGELYSDFVLSTADNGVSSASKPFNDFTRCVINSKLLKNSAESQSKNNTDLIQNNDTEVGVTLNSILILFWKVN